MKSLLVASACAVALCAVVLVGCGNKTGNGTINSEYVAATDGYKVTADDAKLNEAINLGDAVTIKEGEKLQVSPNLTKGKLEVSLKDKSDKVQFSQEVSGQPFATTEVEPGTYDLTVTCKEAGTTGTIEVQVTNS